MEQKAKSMNREGAKVAKDLFFTDPVRKLRISKGSCPAGRYSLLVVHPFSLSVIQFFLCVLCALSEAGGKSFNLKA